MYLRCISHSVAFWRGSLQRNLILCRVDASDRQWRKRLLRIFDPFFFLFDWLAKTRDFFLVAWAAKFWKRDISRGSWGIFGESSVTLAQWWRAMHIRNLVICRSPVRFRPKTRQLRFTWSWAHRPSSKGSTLQFSVIKAIEIKIARPRGHFRVFGRFFGCSTPSRGCTCIS